MAANGTQAAKGVPAFQSTWTDPNGVVHERQPGTRRTTRCGVGMFSHGYVPMRDGCEDCTQESIREYAENHDCKLSGCTDHLRELY